MGNDQPKQQQQQLKTLEQARLDIACLKVKAYLELNRDRKINQALMKEKQLSQQISSSSRVRVDEYQKLSALVIDINYIEACNLVIRCVDVLKGQSRRVCQSQGDANKILDLMPFIETIIWASQHLDLACVQEFKDLMTVFFGVSVYDVSKLKSVDPELKKLFTNPVPDAMEVNAFALKFAEKYGLTVEQLNGPGHQFSPKYLPENQIQQPPQQYYNPDIAPQIDPVMNINIQLQQPYSQNQVYNVQIPHQPQPYTGPNGQGNPYSGNNPYANVGAGQGGQGSHQPPQNNPYQGGFQAPQQGGFQAPQQGGFQAPQSGGFQAPQSGGFQAPQSGGFQAPQQGGFQAPQSGGFQAPQQGGFQPPQSGGFQAPQSGGFQAPQQPNYPQSQQPSYQEPKQNQSFQQPQQPQQPSYQQQSQSNQPIYPQQPPFNQINQNQPPAFQPLPFVPLGGNQPTNPQKPNQGGQPGGLGNPMGGGDDFDEIEARFNRLKNGL